MAKTLATIATAGLAAISVLPGCKDKEMKHYDHYTQDPLVQRVNQIPTYTTNAEENLRADSFGDKDFRINGVSVTKLFGEDYIWIPLKGKQFEVNGKLARNENFFPYFALKRDESTTLINPTKREHTYHPKDDKIIVLKNIEDKIPGMRPTAITSLMAGLPKLNPHQRVSQMEEPFFDIPTLSFPGMPRVHYAELHKKSAENFAGTDKKLVLIPNSNIRIDNETGQITLTPSGYGFYEQEEGELVNPRERIEKQDTIKAEVKWERIPKTETNGFK